MELEKQLEACSWLHLVRGRGAWGGLGGAAFIFETGALDGEEIQSFQRPAAWRNSWTHIHRCHPFLLEPHSTCHRLFFFFFFHSNSLQLANQIQTLACCPLKATLFIQLLKKNGVVWTNYGHMHIVILEQAYNILFCAKFLRSFLNINWSTKVRYQFYFALIEGSTLSSSAFFFFLFFCVCVWEDKGGCKGPTKKGAHYQ